MSETGKRQAPCCSSWCDGSTHGLVFWVASRPEYYEFVLVAQIITNDTCKGGANIYNIYTAVYVGGCSRALSCEHTITYRPGLLERYLYRAILVQNGKGEGEVDEAPVTLVSKRLGERATLKYTHLE